MKNQINKTPNQIVFEGNITFYNLDYPNNIVKPIYIAPNQFKKYTELVPILYNALPEERKKFVNYEDLIETEKGNFRNNFYLVLHPNKKRKSHYGWTWLPTDKLNLLPTMPVKKAENKAKKLDNLFNVKLNMTEVLKPFDHWFAKFGTLLQKNLWEIFSKEIIKTTRTAF